MVSCEIRKRKNITPVKLIKKFNGADGNTKYRRHEKINNPAIGKFMAIWTVIPEKAGIQKIQHRAYRMPSFAGMTKKQPAPDRTLFDQGVTF